MNATAKSHTYSLSKVKKIEKSHDNVQVYPKVSVN